MAADITTLPSNSSASNLTRSSGFASYTRDAKNMCMEELEAEYQRLRDENHQLQLRILGVNELARLLQDKNEQLQLVEEKNKRLEVAVVRLENRCANIEKMSKSQSKGGPTSLPAKTGQSPFIPGPSRQILEGLMKENSELKKTLNNLAKKGASGYLEAVKITQLEDVIGCQQEELQFLKEQIRQLTDSEPSSGGGGLSLPGHVSETGPLKRQLIKLQQASKVKDRFCGLLSQQISELQDKLKIAETEMSKSRNNLSTSAKKVEESAQTSDSSQSDLETKYKKSLEERNSELESLRDQLASTLEKFDRLEKDLREKQKETDESDKLRDQLDFHIAEKQELLETLKTAQSDLEELMNKDSSDGSGGISKEAHKRVERERDDLRKVLEERTSQHSEERKEYDTKTMMLKTQLENEEYKRALTNSEMEHQIKILGQEKAELGREVEQKNDIITELYDNIDGYHGDIQSLREKVRELEIRISTMKYAGQGTPVAGGLIYRAGMPADSGGLIYGNKAGVITVRDGTPSGENRSLPPGHCESPFKFNDMRTPVISRNPEVRQNPERPTQLPPNPQQYGYPPPNMGRASPGGMYYYGNQMAPVSQQPRVAPATIHTPGFNRSPGMYRVNPNNNAIPIPGRSGPPSPYRVVTTPISMATSPTFGGARMGTYPSQNDHPLTTTASMYSHTSPPIMSGQPRMMAPPSSGMRPNHTYPRSDDESSMHGGQRSPSPNPNQRR